MNPAENENFDEYMAELRRGPDVLHEGQQLPFVVPTKPLTEYTQSQIQRATHRRRSLVKALWLTMALTTVPVAIIVAAFISDPPGPHMPAVANGLVFILSLLIVGPFVLLGVAAIVVILLMIAAIEW